jgi:S-adenosylmethionine:tRNA ribosyltransferase-isomerase
VPFKLSRFFMQRTTTAYTLRDFDFVLPPELIAQTPAPERSASRLLDGRGDAPVDRIFHQLPDLLKAGDLLVFNDTQVVKARIFGEKASGGKIELLIERVLLPADADASLDKSFSQYPHQVVAHMRVSKKPAVGGLLHMVGGKAGGGFDALMLGRWPDAQGTLFRLALSDEPYALMQRHGHVPLPPYITHSDSAADESRYQTVLAKHPGAVAAPTAALHFDHALLAELAARGVQHTTLTLHVGAGTFAPVKTEDIAAHQMHSERYHIGPQALSQIAATQAAGGRIVAVGTTSVRSLESWAQTGKASGETRIFITPGFQFRVVDALITNFHLPKSTLMMLVSALAGYDKIMALYAHAIRERYRFFSYGDAMLLERGSN